jgi:hypothetical protein
MQQGICKKSTTNSEKAAVIVVVVVVVVSYCLAYRNRENLLSTPVLHIYDPEPRVNSPVSDRCQ